MSEVESDGTDEAVIGAVRVAVSASAAAAVQLARLRERQARQAEETSQDATRDFAQRREAMWQDTRAQLAPVMEDRWWEEATPEDIGRAYENAKAWEGREDVEPFVDRIREQVRARYGVDVDEVAGDHLAERLSPEGESERQREEAERDRAEATRLLEEANRADRQSETGDPNGAQEEHDHAMSAAADAHTLYDTAQRRDSMAEGMRQQGIEPEVVETRVRADTGQGAPPAEAVRSDRGKSPKARKGRQGAARQRDRARSR